MVLAVQSPVIAAALILRNEYSAAGMAAAMILESASLSMLVIGTAFACCAESYPTRTFAMEFAAGVLIVGGLALTGLGLEWALNPEF